VPFDGYGLDLTEHRVRNNTQPGSLDGLLCSGGDTSIHAALESAARAPPWSTPRVSIQELAGSNGRSN
jgi:hypothetical protein